MKKIISLFSALILTFALTLSSANADKSGVVKIPTHNWSSQLVGAEVVGELLKMVGEKVEYINMDSQACESMLIYSTFSPTIFNNSPTTSAPTNWLDQLWVGIFTTPLLSAFALLKVRANVNIKAENNDIIFFIYTPL